MIFMDKNDVGSLFKDRHRYENGIKKENAKFTDDGIANSSGDSSSVAIVQLIK